MLEHRPLFLTEDEVADLVKDNSRITHYVDAFSRQIKELFLINYHQYIGQDKDEVYKTEDFINYLKLKGESYTHVYFPWNQHLVKTVLADDYFELKTNRNRDLITSDEQKRLYQYKVAVLGMSVGSNIAFVLTQAGISKKIILADFDDLDTTNLNRIFAGVHQIGLNKTIVAARRIYEDNPFAEVEILPSGASEANIESYLANREVDCIVEEVDNISFKVRVRLLAMKYKVPVVMITDNGDGVVLHVERYDKGCSTIWGKKPEYFENKLTADSHMTKELAGQIIMNDIVGGVSRVDPKMLASVKKVLSGELVSWSQLGSAAMLGAVVANYAIKKIALNEEMAIDARIYITPESIVNGDHFS